MRGCRASGAAPLVLAPDPGIDADTILGDITIVSNDPDFPRFTFEIEVPCPWVHDPGADPTPPQ